VSEGYQLPQAYGYLHRDRAQAQVLAGSHDDTVEVDRLINFLTAAKEQVNLTN
jgi:hypothetical protein